MSRFCEFALAVFSAAIWMIVGINVCTLIVRCLENFMNMGQGERFFCLFITTIVYVSVTSLVYGEIKNRRW